MYSYAIYFSKQERCLIFDHQQQVSAGCVRLIFIFVKEVVWNRNYGAVIALFCIFCYGTFPRGELCSNIWSTKHFRLTSNEGIIIGCYRATELRSYVMSKDTRIFE